MNEIEKLIRINVLRDIELEMVKGEKSLIEVIKELEVRYGYNK